MSKWIEVTVTEVTVFAVEIQETDDDDIAIQSALGEISFSEGDKTAEVTERPETDKDVSSVKRFADRVVPL